MPKKTKLEKQKITLIINGQPKVVTLYPPVGTRTSWYAFWQPLVTSRATGQVQLDDAIKAVEQMVQNGGKKVEETSSIMSDEEFILIQEYHFGRKSDVSAANRSAKSLVVCLESIEAFRLISRLKPITIATPDDCARFQRDALKMPKSWRLKYPKARRSEVECLSPNTCLKWSRSLSASFERANINAGRKCVRGVVDEQKLLRSNPWQQFTWIEGRDRPKRQFSHLELNSILDYCEGRWAGMTTLTAAVKVSLWSCARISEVANLSWGNVKNKDGEWHFEIIGKWGIDKWARIPDGLMSELNAIRTESTFVFADYNRQLKLFYGGTSEKSKFVRLVGDKFLPKAFGDWFQSTIALWAKSTGSPHATPHVFRKTGLQHARSGADIISQVANDARITSSVLTGHYIFEREEERRNQSNRTFQRILASLPLELAIRYGHLPTNPRAELEARLVSATKAGDWEIVAKIAQQLSGKSDEPRVD